MQSMLATARAGSGANQVLHQTRIGTARLRIWPKVPEAHLVEPEHHALEKLRYVRP